MQCFRTLQLHSKTNRLVYVNGQGNYIPSSSNLRICLCNLKSHLRELLSKGRSQKRGISYNRITFKEDSVTNQISFTDIEIEIIKRHTIACKVRD